MVGGDRGHLKDEHGQRFSHLVLQISPEGGRWRSHLTDMETEAWRLGACSRSHGWKMLGLDPEAAVTEFLTSVDLSHYPHGGGLRGCGLGVCPETSWVNHHPRLGPKFLIFAPPAWRCFHSTRGFSLPARVGSPRS